MPANWKPTWETNKASHANRVTILANRITQLGGKPTREGGMWVGFAKNIEQGAGMLSKALVISALEQGEDIGLADYRSALDDLDTESLALVTRDLLPAQELTHQRISVLKNSR
jgi:hypothetical protein